MAHSRPTGRSNSSTGILVFLLLVVAGLILWLGVPWMAEQVFGKASPYLSDGQKWSYSAQLLMKKNSLLVAACPLSQKTDFTIHSGDSVATIAANLSGQGIIPDASSFRDYLIYEGLDTQIRADTYQLDCALPATEIAGLIRNKYLTQVSFNILPGWRAEEIAAALPTSGLGVTPEEFLAVVDNPVGIQLPADLSQVASLEGLLLPGEYMIDRDVNAQQLAQMFVDKFASAITPEIVDGFSQQGLDFYQGIILASIVQRETYNDNERPMIASVFYNRLAQGMNLETDPTVQYTLGYSEKYGWWKSPLSASDLQVQSPYNTYLINGLPPAPIANPDLSSIEAVANPAKSDYLYFRAACDGSGTHVFARTFAEHVANQCK